MQKKGGEKKRGGWQEDKSEADTEGMFLTPEAVDVLRNSLFYLALLHLLKQFCDGDFGVADSLVGGALASRQIRGVRITAEAALIGATGTAARWRRSAGMHGAAPCCACECAGLPARGATVRDVERAVAGRFRGARLLGDVPLFWPRLPPRRQPP